MGASDLVFYSMLTSTLLFNFIYPIGYAFAASLMGIRGDLSYFNVEKRNIRLAFPNHFRLILRAACRWLAGGLPNML